jgi:hypothetical protein
MLLLGEIRTCVLHNSAALGRSSVAEILDLVPGERVRLAERPIAHATSPETYTGVDCPLPTASRSRCSGVGTVTARAVVTGGRLLQGCAHVEVRRGASDHRMAWSHYLAAPGVLETAGNFAEPDVAAGFLAELDRTEAIDLGAVTERLINAIQSGRQLDHANPMRAPRTRLRWAAVIGPTENGAGPSVPTGLFTVVDGAVRTLDLASTVQLNSPEAVRKLVADLRGFCENLALHDWALTTLINQVERSGLGPAGRDAILRLRPAIDHLLHLWMPGAHVDPSMSTLWESLERRPGFTRQWSTIVARIRDQLALHALGTPQHADLVEQAATDS